MPVPLPLKHLFTGSKDTKTPGVPELTYLFIAEFHDGTRVKQTADDQPKIEGGRNCYSDVLTHQKNGKKLIRFSLIGKNNLIEVDLITGLFYVNGVELLLEGEKVPTLPDVFTLVWYHQVTRDQRISYSLKTGEVISTEYPPEFREYFIGWECEIAGKKYTQKLAVA